MIIYYLTFSSLPSNFMYSLPETNSLDTEYLKAITDENENIEKEISI